jgi:hydroxypyruvate isomerase
MKVELTQEQIKFLLEMINVLNFPGREVERVYELKKIFSNIDIVDDKK